MTKRLKILDLYSHGDYFFLTDFFIDHKTTIQIFWEDIKNAKIKKSWFSNYIKIKFQDNSEASFKISKDCSKEFMEEYRQKENCQTIRNQKEINKNNFINNL